MRKFKKIFYCCIIAGALFYGLQPGVGKAEDKTVINYQIEKETVTKQQFERLKERLIIERSMIEGWGPQSNIQYYKAKDKDGNPYRYTVKSKTDETTNMETATFILERLSKKEAAEQ